MAREGKADDRIGFASLRSRRFKELMSKPATLYVLAGVPIPAAIIADLTTGSGRVAGLAALGVAVAVFAWRYSRAEREAEDAVMSAWGERHGMAFVQELELGPETPLLRRGDRRRAENGLFHLGDTDAGPLVCHYTYAERRHDSDGDAGWTSHPFTVCRIKLRGSQWPEVPRLRVQPRRPLEGRLADRLGSAVSDERLVELESAEFAERFRLWVPDGQREAPLRSLFTPSFIVWWIDEAPADLLLELEWGVLVAALPGRQREPDALEGLLRAADGIAHHVESHATRFHETRSFA